MHGVHVRCTFSLYLSLVGGVDGYLCCCYPPGGTDGIADCGGLCPGGVGRLDQGWDRSYRITIEASEVAAAEIEHRFGGVLLIEPELTSDAEAQRALWLEKNKDAIEAHNRMIERDGLPLDEFRQF